MRLRLLLCALLCAALLPRARSGLASAENHCLNLQGICRRDTCKLMEDVVGGCRLRWKCCRKWWVLLPIPTPLIYSDYREPLRGRLK